VVFPDPEVPINATIWLLLISRLKFENIVYFSLGIQSTGSVSLFPVRMYLNVFHINFFWSFLSIRPSFYASNFLWDQFLGWNITTFQLGTIYRWISMTFVFHFSIYLVTVNGSFSRLLGWVCQGMASLPKPKKDCTLQFYINGLLDSDILATWWFNCSGKLINY